MSNQTTAFAALATSQQIGYAIPYIDVNSLQPTLDSGNINGVTTGGGFVYVPNVSGGPAAQVGALSVGTAGDYTGTDPINSGWQLDSYVPTTNQNINVVGGVPGHTVSMSRGTRYIPAIVADGDFNGEFAGYGLVTNAGVNGYAKLSGINMYAKGVSATYVGGEMRFATRADGGATLTEWAVLTNAGNLKLSGTFSPPLLAAAAGVFQAVAQLYVVTGVPANGNGANGDFALRSDGGVGSCIYQKRAGAWVATGA